jgi:hypothetical protein
MKPFSWSWSKLKNYRSCPKRHYEIDLAKSVVEPESEPLKWGHDVHQAMANRIAKGTELPPTMQHYHEWPDRMLAVKKMGARMLVENKLAMSADFKPTSFFDASTWFRGVVDVLTFGVTRAGSIDWKTGGNVNPEYEQLGLSAQLIFAHYPEIEEVDSVYVWLGHTHDDGSAITTRKTYARDAMVPLWNGLMPEIAQMTEAYRTTTYPPKPSGLCKRHCPVESCPYHGKGSR